MTTYIDPPSDYCPHCESVREGGQSEDSIKGYRCGTSCDRAGMPDRPESIYQSALCELWVRVNRLEQATESDGKP